MNYRVHTDAIKENLIPPVLTPQQISYTYASEADSGGETEAGTVQRDVVRTGVVTISVSFSVAQKWLRLLTGYKKQEKIRVGFFDPETASVRQTEMYVEGFKAKLKKDTSYKGLWIVIFTLKEL